MEKVHIFHKNGVRHTDAGGGIIENALDACLDKLRGCALRAFRRGRDDPDFNIEYRHPLHKGFCAVNFKPVGSFPYLERITVKGGYNGKAAAAEFPMVEQRPPEISHSHQGCPPFAVGVQAHLDGFKQVGNIIPYAPDAEYAEVGKVLANMGCDYVTGPGQAFGGNNLHTFLVHGFKNLQIGGETLNGGAGDMYVFRGHVHYFSLVA